MALTNFQKTVVRLIADNRRQSGDSYIAGGAALNLLIGAPRVSSDVDIFHDSEEAVHAAFTADRIALEANGLEVDIKREWVTFVEATISRDGQTTELQWALDSAFRFFPLIEHSDLGLSLHPFDLATNKVLALVGRALPRDWIDIMECDSRLQPLGFLAWAGSGKDPGLNPVFILDQAARSARYTEPEISRLEFEGQSPSAAELSLRWKRILAEAREVVELLPGDEVGKCLDSASLKSAASAGTLRFHEGRLRGAFPEIVDSS